MILLEIMYRKVIGLKNTINLEDLKKIYFGNLFYYDLNDDGIFYNSHDSTYAIGELLEITEKLNDNDIEYSVDKDYNIKIEIN